MWKYENKYIKCVRCCYSGFVCDILSLNVKMYLRLKLYTVPFFVSGQTYKISKGSNNYCSLCMLLSRRRLFPGTPCLLQHDNAGLILHALQQHSIWGIECLTGLPAVQIGLLLKMYGTSWRGDSDKGDHGLLSSSSLVYTKNGQKFHLQNCNNGYLQYPNDYKV